MADYDLVTLEEAQTYLQLDAAPADLQMLIANISARIEAHTGRWFVVRAVTDILDADGGPVLFLSRFPVQETPAVTDLTTGQTVTDFLCYPDRGLLYREAGWEAGRRRYKVEYTAGICQYTASVPADVKQACLEWLAARYNRRDPSLQRESLGDYSYAADEKEGMPAGVKAALSLWCVPRGC